MNDKPKRRWFQFRLSTWFVLFVVLSQLFLLIEAARERSRLKSRIAEMEKAVASARLLGEQTVKILLQVRDEKMPGEEVPREIEKLEEMTKDLPSP